MKPVGQAGQCSFQPLYRADGTITAGGTAQLILSRSRSRSYLLFQNLSSGPMFLEIGCAQAHCAITNGVVTSVTIDNAGFNFTYPPVVAFLGGGDAGNGTYLPVPQPNEPVPSAANGGRQARGLAVLTSRALSSITIIDGGAGYGIAPYVHLQNSDLDPHGCSLPANGVGILVGANGEREYNGSCCPLDPISVWGPTTGAAFTCRWMD